MAGASAAAPRVRLPVAFQRLMSLPHLFVLLMPLLVAIIGIAASALVAFEVGRVARAKDEERFEHSVAQGQDGIDGRLQTYIAMLRAGAGLMEAHDGVVDRRTFRTFANELELGAHYPGIQGIGFTARLPGPTLAAAERVGDRLRRA